MYFKNLQRIDIYSYNKYLFKDNTNLNERWDAYNHSFYEQVLNGNLYPKDNMVSKGNQIQQGK